VAAITKQRSAGVKNSSQKTNISVDNANESAQSHHIAEGHPEDRTSRRKESASTADEVADSMVNPLVPLIVDELLACVSFYCNNSNIDALRSTVLSFYSPTSICFSKKILIDKLSSLLIDSPLVADRRSSSTRASHEAEIYEILNLIDILDLQSEFIRFKFFAFNLDNLPKFGPEEINIAVVVNRQARVEASVQNISSRVHELVTNQEKLLLTGSAIKDMAAADE